MEFIPCGLLGLLYGWYWDDFFNPSACKELKYGIFVSDLIFLPIGLLSVGYLRYIARDWVPPPSSLEMLCLINVFFTLYSLGKSVLIKLGALKRK